MKKSVCSKCPVSRISGSLLEKILRHVGLIKVNNLTWFQLIRWLGPDIAALAGLILIYLSISNILSRGQVGPEANDGAKENGFSKMLSSVGSYLILGFLCFTSSLQPSVSSGVYFIVFIAGATAWATGSINIHNKCFAWFYAFLAFYVAVHFAALFAYQLEVLQEVLEPDSLISRLALKKIEFRANVKQNAEMPCYFQVHLNDISMLYVI